MQCLIFLILFGRGPLDELTYYLVENNLISEEAPVTIHMQEVKRYAASIGALSVHACILHLAYAYTRT